MTKQPREKFIKIKIPISQAVKAQEQHQHLSLTQAVIKQLTLQNTDHSHERAQTNDTTIKR
jgi:hypothetical protein